MLGVQLAEYITASEQVLKVISFAIILIVTFLILGLVAKALEGILNLVMLGWVNKLLGGAFAIAEICGIDLDAFFDGLLITKAWSTFVIVLAFGVILMFVSYKISVTFMEKREF